MGSILSSSSESAEIAFNGYSTSCSVLEVPSKNLVDSWGSHFRVSTNPVALHIHRVELILHSRDCDYVTTVVFDSPPHESYEFSGRQVLHDIAMGIAILRLKYRSVFDTSEFVCFLCLPRTHSEKSAFTFRQAISMSIRKYLLLKRVIRRFKAHITSNPVPPRRLSRSTSINSCSSSRSLTTITTSSSV